MKQALPADTQAMLNCLQETIHQTLERKRKLGQYAIIGQNGSIIKLAPSSSSVNEEKAKYNSSDEQQR